MPDQPLRRHVIADVHGCTIDLNDDDKLLGLLSAACENGGATVLDFTTHRFEPQGATVLVLLAESHASVHTWPEYGMAFVDVFTCGDVAPEPIARAFCAQLGGYAEVADISSAALVP